MNRYLILAFALALTVFFAVVNCGEENDLKVLPGSGDYSSISTPIYNGNPPDSPEHEAVVGLHQLTKGGKEIYVQPFCSGTLIASDVVLTAAHCLDTANPLKTDFATIKPTDLAIYVGDDPSQDLLQHLYFVTETLIFPDYDRLAIRNDLALIRLSSSVTEPVAPVPHLPASQGFTSADIGSIINIAGFGQTETGSSGIKLQVDVPLAGFGCSVAGCYDAGDAATQISYAQQDGGPCFGDSGGPAFAYRNGTPYVGGVTSYGDSYCLYYGVSTRIDAFQSWIDDFVSGLDCSADGYCNPDCAEGEDPDCSTPVPDCSADGYCNPDCEAGEDPDCEIPSNDCGNNVCDADESCDGRYDTVDCPEDCPGKSTGKPSGRYCFVGDFCEGGGCP